MALSSVAVMGLSSVSASAMTNDKLVSTTTKLVNSKNGLNLRDDKCKKIGSVASKSLVLATGGESITCKINGKKAKMTAVYIDKTKTSAYVVSSFLTNVYSTQYVQNSYAQLKGTLHAKTKLNVRDANCNIAYTTEKDADLKRDGSFYADEVKACKFGNKYYLMLPVRHNELGGFVSPTGVYVK